MKKTNAVRRKVNNMVLSSFFLALGMVLPFLTMQIKEVGNALLPMHFAVMLCGVICGEKYGGVVGFVLPFLRFACFGMPPLFPNAIWMSCELLTYGFVIGFFYRALKIKSEWIRTFISLCISMISGRIVWGAVKTVIMNIVGGSFSFYLFLTEGFLNSSLGILAQLAVIPIIMVIKGRSDV